MRRVYPFCRFAIVSLSFFPHLWGSAAVDPPDPNVVVQPRLLEGLKYRLIGPFRGGRSTAVAGVPDQPHTFYMGSTGGGVWKTEDAGETWENISDEFFEAGSIGAIAVADSDPNILYVGTGSACPRGNVSAGVGVYKSTDAGKTWSHVGLREAGQIGRIRIHPRNPDLVYVAALGHIFGPNPERGVFRSKDGGQTWEKVLYVSEKTGAVDLAMDVRNPRILYAAMWTAERKPWTFISGSEEGGLYRSSDGGDTWQKLEGGLPTGVVGKIGVSVSPADPNRVWALVEAEKGGLFRSDDGGKNWRAVNRERKLLQRAWYYTHVYADPQDPDTVYALNTSFYKSIDGGKTFEAIPVLHGDCHDLWLNPHNPQILIQANDGGAHVSLNGGKSWSTLYNQPTAEMYRLTLDNQFPYRVYGAQQDNSTISVPSRNPGGITPYQHWYSVGGCESGHIAVDPRNPRIVYAGCYGGAISRTNVETGESRDILVYPQLQLGQAPRDLKYRFQWNAPIRLSPHNPDVLYHTSQVVHRSLDQGHSWESISPDLTRNDKEKQDYAGEPITRDNTGVEVYGTIFAFEESPLQAGLLWAGSDDGLVHISRDNGKSWQNITPQEMPEWATVNTIELSAHDPGRALLAVHRYRLDDFQPYIFRTNDYGQSWELLTDGKNGIPANHFVRVVREDPQRKGLLFAGTEFGMYVSFDDGRHWQSLQLNLPTTPITDLAVHQDDLVLATQGRSFWILDDMTPLRTLHQVNPQEKQLFKPRDAYLASFRGGSRTGDAVPNGAIIRYYLPEEVKEEVKIEILDSSGEVVQTFSSQEQRERSGGGFFSAGASSTPSAKAGLQSFLWNLRYPAVRTVEDAIVWGFTGGPQATPGTYQVRISVGDWSQSHSFQVLKDPRITVSDEDLVKRFRLMVEIRDQLNEVYDAIRTIRSVRSQVKELAQRAQEAGKGEELKKLSEEIGKKLTSVEERLMQTRNESRQDPLNFPPMLDNQFAYLYGYVGGSDGPPTEGALQRFEDLKREFAALQEELQGILETELEQFNQRFRELQLPAVVLPAQKP